MTSALRRVQALIAASAPRAMEGARIDNKCRECAFRREVPGNCHIECVKPDADMTGSPHGIRNGWFMYPLLFDPVWMTSKCKNFEPVNQARQSSGKSE